VIGGWWALRLLGQQGSWASLRSPRRLGCGVAGGLSRPSPPQPGVRRAGRHPGPFVRPGGSVVCGVASAVELSMNEPLRASRTALDGTSWRLTGWISPRPVATTAEEHGRGAAMSQMAARSGCRCRPTRDTRSTGRRRASNRHATHRSARTQRVPDTGAQLARRRSLREGGPPYGRVAAPMPTGQWSLGREPQQALKERRFGTDPRSEDDQPHGMPVQ